MQIFEELQERGLIAQVTDETEIRDIINEGKATFYIGLGLVILLFKDVRDEFFPEKIQLFESLRMIIAIM